MHEQAIRDKITFSCNDDPSKLKLYYQGTDLSLEKAIQIPSLKKTSRLELQESKSATIDAIRYKRRGYCNLKHTQGKRFCPAAKHTCEKCRKAGHYAVICRSSKRAQVNQVTHTNLPQHQPINPVVGPMPTFIGRTANEARNEKEPLESGWQINLQSGDEKLTWCLDTGAQVSVILKSAYKPKNGKLSATDRDLLAAGDTARDSWICGDVLKTWPKFC